ncbi:MULTISPECIES: TetR/AcrR family transcriptional regulator [Actinoplanes]|uniref:TetR/AcrR family transcriptional regulator n=1 Tax=Actinoplanes TaxID=1865 RepID=UPI0005F2B026|nr:MULTISPECIES: TetR/AcrR family transcriptional regulator [Actinoplanes]GLY02474.1 TetR family transcriptional regulator [Actinoplanes sp. NBRC 101535]
MTSDRPLRADAARNRALLLAAAEAAFAERGMDVSVADIAQRAGIGKGTVFRHFATKDDLLAEVVLDRVGVLIHTGQRLRDAADPGDALLEFLTIAAERQQRGDLSVLRDAHPVNDRLSGARLAMNGVIEVLVDRARRAGAIRPDVTAADVVLLMCAPGHVASFAPDAGPDLWRRYLAIIFDGLRPAGATPLPVPPPDAGVTP